MLAKMKGISILLLNKFDFCDIMIEFDFLLLSMGCKVIGNLNPLYKFIRYPKVILIVIFLFSFTFNLYCN